MKMKMFSPYSRRYYIIIVVMSIFNIIRESNSLLRLRTQTKRQNQ